MLPTIPQQNYLNLDRIAAQRAQEIINNTRDDRASEIDTTLTKTLGVLQEAGFYACFLYLLSKEPKGHARVVRELVNLLQDLNFGWTNPGPTLDAQTVLPYVTNHVTADLERMLLAKETAEQMLTYARYGAKALS